MQDYKAVQPNLRIVSIGNEPAVSTRLQNIIENIDVNFEYEAFKHPSDAVIENKSRPADVIISDYRTASMTERKLLTDMRMSAPGGVHILIAEKEDFEDALKEVNKAPVFRFFIKPVPVHDLTIGIYDAIRERNLRKMRAVLDSSMGAIERIQVAIASVDMKGRVIYANAPARKILYDSGFFKVDRDCVLQSYDFQETKMFYQFLNGTLKRDGETETPNIFRFQHPKLKDSLIVSLLNEGGSGATDKYVNLLISNPNRKHFATEFEIAAALNLIPCEARVVKGLIDGGSIDEAAKFAHVSLNTARTYLKNVFSKTGVSKQAELVKLVFLSVA